MRSLFLALVPWLMLAADVPGSARTDSVLDAVKLAASPAVAARNFGWRPAAAWWSDPQPQPSPSAKRRGGRRALILLGVAAIGTGAYLTGSSFYRTPIEATPVTIRQCPIPNLPGLCSDISLGNELSGGEWRYRSGRLSGGLAAIGGGVALIIAGAR